MDPYIILILACTGLILGLLLVVYVYARKTRERVNYFHWMYNIRFRRLLLALGAESKYRYADEQEFKEMVEKMSSMYHNKSRKQIIEILEIHYSQLSNFETLKKELIKDLSEL